MEAKCSDCKALRMEEQIRPVDRISGKYYNCSYGRFSEVGRTYLIWFAWSGIVKPNKTVKEAQDNCPSFIQQT